MSSDELRALLVDTNDAISKLATVLADRPEDQVVAINIASLRKRRATIIERITAMMESPKQGWLRANPIANTEQPSHYYRECRDDHAMASFVGAFESLCGLGMAATENVVNDMDFSELPILPICKKCLIVYKNEAR